MSRVEENRKFIEFIEDEAGEKKEVSYDEGVMFQLGAINCILSDISKSLAVIADKTESEGRK